MKNWLKNTLIAGGILAGSMKGFSQTNEEFTKHLSGSSNWKNYEVQEGMEQPKYLTKLLLSNLEGHSSYQDTSNWYDVQEGIKQPEYCSKDSVKNFELPSFKDSKKKLDIENISEMKSLGYGYVTSKEEFDLYGGKNYSTLRLIEGLKEGSVKISHDGRRAYLDGKLYGEPSEVILDEVDVNNDKIVTTKEIYNSLKNEYKDTFLDYASKELEVPKNEVVDVGKGYFTSKNLEGRLNNLLDDYEERFQRPRHGICEHMGNDNVFTEDEISKTEKVLNKYLEKQ